MKLLEGKVAIVTGGSRGIGKGIVNKLAEQGATVVFTFVSSEEAAQAVANDAAANYGVTVKAVKNDAASFSQAEELIENTVKEFGRIDIVVNNAGITKDNLLMRMTEADWDAVIDTNLKSVFNMTKAVQKVMLKQRSGSIINLSSVVGRSGNAGQANYAASKSGVIGFTQAIARELGSRNIRCNAIAPGFIETEMTEKLDENTKNGWIQNIPLKRAGTTEDVANCVLFLASDLSSYISGQTINVCGAMLTN
ncbi:MAG TPA: 3-oxoacyl-[acyl-carrier-protein] reductase [Bacteroidia bacterium]